MMRERMIVSRQPKVVNVGTFHKRNMYWLKMSVPRPIVKQVKRWATTSII